MIMLYSRAVLNKRLYQSERSGPACAHGATEAKFEGISISSLPGNFCVHSESEYLA